MKKISLIVLLMCSLLAAQTTTDLYNKLNNRYKNIVSFQADITQVNHFVQLKRSIEYQGKFYFEKNRMLMSFTNPSIQRLFIHNGAAELFDADSGTLFKSQVTPEFNKMNPLEILEHYWKRSEVRISEQNTGQSKVTLSPKQDPLIHKLEATINSGSGIVTQLSYTDKSANTVRYEFSNILLDKKIDPSIWQYNYPKTTRIIEQ